MILPRGEWPNGKNQGVRPHGMKNEMLDHRGYKGQTKMKAFFRKSEYLSRDFDPFIEY